MKKLIHYILDFHTNNFNWKLYLSISLFLGICIFTNHQYSFKGLLLGNYSSIIVEWFEYFYFFAIPYLSICFILYYFGLAKDWLRDSRFWLRFIIAFGILAIDQVKYLTPLLVNQLLEYDQYVYITLLQFESFITIFVPLFIAYWFLERDEKPKLFYGLRWQDTNFSPYLILLLLVFCLVMVGSFFQDIQNYYPRFDKIGIDVFVQKNILSYRQSVGLYELFYGLDFITIEFFFRGFLILGMVKVLGPYAVFPMVGVYTFLHFGKPDTEIISSIFGGYLLGILTLYSKRLWGGIILHMGLAWTMEIVGYLHKQ